MRIAVVGVATDVGKTWVGARLLEALRAEGLVVAARKPVQSFEPGSDGGTDADVLAAATGESPGDVCPPHRWYPVAMAPPMAADALGRDPFGAADLLGELAWPDQIDVGLVETVGGARSPLSADADSATFARLVEPDRTLLVADAGLGTINAVRLSVDALSGLDPLVYLNRYDDANDLHQRNRAWLTDRDRLQVVTGAHALRAELGLASGADKSGGSRRRS